MEALVTERTVYRLSTALLPRVEGRGTIPLAEAVEDEILVAAAHAAGVSRPELDKMSAPQIRATPDVTRWYHVIVETVLQRLRDTSVATDSFWAGVNARSTFKQSREAALAMLPDDATPLAFVLRPESIVDRLKPEGGWGASTFARDGVVPHRSKRVRTEQSTGDQGDDVAMSTVANSAAAGDGAAGAGVTAPSTPSTHGLLSAGPAPSLEATMRWPMLLPDTTGAPSSSSSAPPPRSALDEQGVRTLYGSYLDLLGGGAGAHGTPSTAAAEGAGPAHSASATTGSAHDPLIAGGSSSSSSSSSGGGGAGLGLNLESFIGSDTAAPDSSSSPAAAAGLSGRPPGSLALAGIALPLAGILPRRMLSNEDGVDGNVPGVPTAAGRSRGRGGYIRGRGSRAYSYVHLQRASIQPRLVKEQERAVGIAPPLRGRGAWARGGGRGRGRGRPPKAGGTARPVMPAKRPPALVGVAAPPPMPLFQTAHSASAGAGGFKLKFKVAAAPSSSSLSSFAATDATDGAAAASGMPYSDDSESYAGMASSERGAFQDIDTGSMSFGQMPQGGSNTDSAAGSSAFPSTYGHPDDGIRYAASGTDTYQPDAGAQYDTSAALDEGGPHQLEDEGQGEGEGEDGYAEDGEGVKYGHDEAEEGAGEDGELEEGQAVYAGDEAGYDGEDALEGLEGDNEEWGDDEVQILPREGPFGAPFELGGESSDVPGAQQPYEDADIEIL